MGKAKSKTEETSSAEEYFFDESHFKTTISDGKDKVTGDASSSEESQRRASEKWDKLH